MPFIPINKFLLIKSKKGGKDFYKILNNNIDKPTSQPKWENTYNIEQETCKVIYVSPFTLPKSTKLQWFQVRINHRILPTRKLLHKMKYVQNSTCNSCGKEETISHLLWTCPESQSLIKKLTTCSCLINKNVNLSFIEESFSFNIGNTYTTADLYLFIIIKLYIYAMKRLISIYHLLHFSEKVSIYTAWNSTQQQEKTVSTNESKNGLNTDIIYCQFIECSQNFPDNTNIIP